MWRFVRLERRYRVFRAPEILFLYIIPTLFMKPILLIGIAGAALVPRLLAATFTVTSLKSGGVGTLREAIEAANANPGPDVIHFKLAGAGQFHRH